MSARLWQLKSLQDRISLASAGSLERLYERFIIDRPGIIEVNLGEEQWIAIQTISFGGMSFTVEDQRHDNLKDGSRIYGNIRLWDTVCPFAARCVAVRRSNGQTVIATQFVFETIELMDFLRAFIPYMRIGYFLAQEEYESIGENIVFDISGIEQIDYDAELAINRTANGLAASLVISYGNAQIAVNSPSAKQLATYKNLSLGAEIATFARGAQIDLRILEKATLTIIGFLSLAEGEADVRMLLGCFCQHMDEARLKIVK